MSLWQKWGLAPSFEVPVPSFATGSMNRGTNAMPRVTINGQTVEAPQGQTILEAARQVGIRIPTLCYHKDLSVAGSCRLCLVEVERMPAVVPACATRVIDGMVVHAETPPLVQSRRFVLELLLRHYVDDGYAAGDHDETEFLHWVKHY